MPAMAKLHWGKEGLWPVGPIQSPVMKGLFECKASKSNIRRIRVKDIVKEVEDYLKTYSSAVMDISWRETQYYLKARQKVI
ncbi:hypothetical protein Tco_0243397 [Tanacetum coccineum]